MKALTAILLCLLAAPAAAQAPVDAAQRRCFCLQPNPPGAPVPYYLGRMDWAECKGRQADFATGNDPFAFGLLSCDELMTCLKAPPKEKKTREAALKKVADITGALQACCRGDMQNCPKECVEKYGPALEDAKKKSEKLERKALRRQDACIAAKKPFKPPKK